MLSNEIFLPPLLPGGCGDSDTSAGGAGPDLAPPPVRDTRSAPHHLSGTRAPHPLPVRDTHSAPTLTQGQVVPGPVIATQRNHVVQVGVTDLEPFVTGDDQPISVSVGLVMDVSVFHLRDAAICNGRDRTRYYPDSNWWWFPASLLFPDLASGSTLGSGSAREQHSLLLRDTRRVTGRDMGRDMGRDTGRDMGRDTGRDGGTQGGTREDSVTKITSSPACDT